MFDPKSVDAYRNIQAPEHLRERVFSASPKKAKHFSPRYAGLLAAELAAVFFAVSLFSTHPVGVTVGGVTLSEHATVLPSEIAVARMRSLACTTQSVCFDEPVTVLSADGILTDAEGTELSLPLELSAQTTVFWQAEVPPDTFVLTAQTAEGKINLVLTYEESENYWTVCRQ